MATMAYAQQAGNMWDGAPQNGGPSPDDDNEPDPHSATRVFERSRIKALAEERQAVQKRTFTKWINSHLARANIRVEDLLVDLRDGIALIKLLEQLSGERLTKPTRGRMRIHCLENVDKAIQFLLDQHVHLENVGASDIVDGNGTITLGLIWTIILRFQIQDIRVEDDSSGQATREAKDALLLWCQMKTAGYPNVNVRNFTSSFRDGLALNAIIHRHRPDLLDFAKLNKAQQNANLEQAFRIADDRLGIARLLEPEDVNTDNPDERSILTYVATYYHYFNKMKTDSVSAKRCAKFLNNRLEIDKRIVDYERLASDLLKWISATIRKLDEREFVNSLAGVQQQLAAFNSYRNTEKPPKFLEKGNLEMSMFAIQSSLVAANQKPYTPENGKLIADLSSAWERLDKSEHERELALHDELIRQEKLEQLAARFDRKASMRETWLTENQQLVIQDNFGSDLPTVEASEKKHEAIETDILAYEERVQAVVAVSDELEREDYHDKDRIVQRKDKVLTLWRYLRELLEKRGKRLALSLELHRLFQEMLYVVDWIADMQALATMEDYGKHLLGVEDLLQKHELLDSDVKIAGERVDTLTSQAQRFVDGEMPADVGDYRPREPSVVSERIGVLRAAYDELVKATRTRKRRLTHARAMWQYIGELADEAQWMREQQQLMTSPDHGRDLTTCDALLEKHAIFERLLEPRRDKLEKLLAQADEHARLTAPFGGASRIGEAVKEANAEWDVLVEATARRKHALLAAQAYYAFFADSAEFESWAVESSRVLSDANCGRDEASVQSLLKKFQQVADEVVANEQQLQALHESAERLAEPERSGLEVVNTLKRIDDQYMQAVDAMNRRKQALLDALSLYRLFNDADLVEAWITEKEKLLRALTIGQDFEELEVIKHRFDSFEVELSNTHQRVESVNATADRLVASDENQANRDAIERRRAQMNERWRELLALADAKRREVSNAYSLRQFFVEANETAVWIKDKQKLVLSTDELGSDLDGIMQLQRRLAGLERDLSAIEAKRDELHASGDRLKVENPEEHDRIDVALQNLDELWRELKELLSIRDARLRQSSELQQFFQSLDHFQVWLSRTQSALANVDLPEDVAACERALAENRALKDEIATYDPEYSHIAQYGRSVTEGQNDPQHVFLRQRIEAIEADWEELQKMWAHREHELEQALKYAVFVRDAHAADLLLSHQENLLSKEEVANSPEHVERLIKQLEQFFATLDAQDAKITDVLLYGHQLINEQNHTDRVSAKCESIEARRKANRERAELKLSRLTADRDVLQLLTECDELADWLSDKLAQAADDQLGGQQKDIRAKYNKHKAFQSEIAANRDRLHELANKCNALLAEHPEYEDRVRPKLEELQNAYNDLETTLQDRDERLFGARHGEILDANTREADNWLKELESQMLTEEMPDEQPITAIATQAVFAEQKKQEKLEQNVRQLENMMQQLADDAEIVKKTNPEQCSAIMKQHHEIQQRLILLQNPLREKKDAVEKARRVNQFLRDCADESMWIEEKLAIAQRHDLAQSLLAAQLAQKRARSLRSEVDNHRPLVDALLDEGRVLVAELPAEADRFQQAMDQLTDGWQKLLAALDDRQAQLNANELVQRYLHDADEAESWMGELELNLITDAQPRDEQAANNAMRKHEQLESSITAYEDELAALRKLADEAKQDGADKLHDIGEAAGDEKLADEGTKAKEQIEAKQARLERAFNSLQELADERRRRCEDMLQLFSVQHDIDDLEAWLLERTAVASSHDLGQSLEHVSVLRERFSEFSRETEQLGTEKMATAFEHCDGLIGKNHPDSATIAEWKDRIGELWADLLELLQTRAQLLRASFERFRYLNDCAETLERILEKQATAPQSPPPGTHFDISPEEARRAAELERELATWSRELPAIELQVNQVVDDARVLLPAYSDEREREIRDRRDEVLAAWRALQALNSAKRAALHDASDLLRFGNLVKELTAWLRELDGELDKSDRPTDVSGVQLAAAQNRTHRAELDAREETFAVFTNLARSLLSRPNFPHSDVRAQTQAVLGNRFDVAERITEQAKRLEELCEVFEFAHDAAVAECWLTAQDGYLANEHVGDSLDEVDALLKKHEAFEKSAEQQEHRFDKLAAPTRFEEAEKQRTPEWHENRRRDKADRKRNALKEFDEPPPKPVAPARQPEPTKKQPEAPRKDEADGEEVTVVARTPAQFSQPPARQSDDRAKSTMPAASKPESTERRPVSEMPVPRPSEASSTATSRQSTLKPGAQLAQAPAQAQPASAKEGLLQRKHEWESAERKSSSRSWSNIYVVLRSDGLYAYKDQKHARTEPSNYYHGEPPLDLRGASAQPASDYTKKTNVMRLRLSNGGQYLFVCANQDDLRDWVAAVNQVAMRLGGEQSAAARASTMPAPGSSQLSEAVAAGSQSPRTGKSLKKTASSKKK